MDLASERRRVGYRRLISPSTAKTLLPSNTRAHPLYRPAGFAVPKHVAVKRRRCACRRAHTTPHRVEELVFDALTNGRPITSLNVAVKCAKNTVEIAGR